VVGIGWNSNGNKKQKQEINTRHVKYGTAGLCRCQLQVLRAPIMATAATMLITANKQLRSRGIVMSVDAECCVGFS